jgi:hypothetical protein
MSRTTTRIRTLAAATIGVAGVMAVSAGVVGAQESSEDVTLSYSLDTVVFAPEGTVQELVSTDIADDLVGQECMVTLTSENNESVHPDNDLIITSGTDEVVVPDVEAESFEILTADETLVLGPTLTVSVRLGPDGVLSEGGLLELACVEPDVVTTTTSTTTSTPGPEVQGATASAGAAGAAEVSPSFTG